MASSDASRTLVRRNALWNAFGLGLPLVLAFLFIPRLIEGMGPERFGILTLVLAFLNYFGFLDFGIGRALIQLLAGPAADDPKKEAELIWTVSGLLGMLGGATGLLVIVAAPYLVHDFFRIQEPVASETVAALRCLGLTLPMLLHSMALRGVLEARRRFDLSNLVRIPAGAFTFGAPLAVLPITHNLVAVVGVVLLGRVLAWALNLWMVFRLLPHLTNKVAWNGAEAGGILRFGGWFTVSNIVGPIIDAMDRFFIGRLLSVKVIAYYTVPFEMVTKLGILSGSVGGAVYPEFASRLRKSPEEAAVLFRRGLKYIIALLFPFVLLITAYAPEGLTLWLNAGFAAESAPILRWLTIFVFLVGASLIPLTFLQGAGRPDLAAFMHLIEVPIYAALLYVFIKWDGLRGASIAITLRILIDFLGMLWFSGRILRFKAATYLKVITPVAGVIGVLLVFHIPFSLSVKSGLVALAFAVYAVGLWTVILEEGDKARIRGIAGFKRFGRK